jgi:hypothetical protein
LKGQLIVDNDALIYAYGDGITFGDQTSSDDMQLILRPNFSLTCEEGTFNYKNVNASSLQMKINSTLNIGDGVILNVYEDMNLGDSSVMFGYLAQYVHHSGKSLIGSYGGSYYIEKYV